MGSNQGQSSSRCLKVWEDGGRKFKLEYRSNEAGRFLLRSVQDVGDKKYCLIFLKGKGLVGGWFLLAKKLRALGVSTLAMSKVFSGVPIFEKVRCSFKEKVKGTYADATRVKTGGPGESLWLHFGDQELLCKEEQLSRYLVGCFGNNSDSVPPLLSLKGWVHAQWALRGGGLKISKLGGPFCCSSLRINVRLIWCF